MDPFDTNNIAIAFSVIVLGLSFIGCYLAARDTYWQKGRWGPKKEPLSCRQCDTLAPVIRLPKNPDQALWGGWTCCECGCEYDRWGNPVDNQTILSKWSSRLDDRTASDLRMKPSDDIQRRDEYRE